jgi:hypothetical protein
MLPLRGSGKGAARVFLKAPENRDWLSISPNTLWVLFRAGGHPGNRLVLRPLGSESGKLPIGHEATEGIRAPTAASFTTSPTGP